MSYFGYLAASAVLLGAYFGYPSLLDAAKKETPSFGIQPISNSQSSSANNKNIGLGLDKFRKVTPSTPKPKGTKEIHIKGAVAVPPEVISRQCRRQEEACLEILLNGENFNAPVEELFPIDWVYQCTDEHKSGCVLHRHPNVMKVIPSPPAPPIPLMFLTYYEYAVVCHENTGMCGWQRYTDFERLPELGIPQQERDCEDRPSDPLPGDGDDPPPPRCGLVNPEEIRVVIEGEVVEVIPAGTTRGCIVPDVEGAWMPNSDRFNRERDYMEVVANDYTENRRCPGSYRVILSTGRVCFVPCLYGTGGMIYDFNAFDDNDIACYITLRAPSCQ